MRLGFYRHVWVDGVERLAHRSFQDPLSKLRGILRARYADLIMVREQEPRIDKDLGPAQDITVTPEIPPLYRLLLEASPRDFSFLKL